MVDRRVRYLVISLVFLKELKLGFKASLKVNIWCSE